MTPLPHTEYLQQDYCFGSSRAINVAAKMALVMTPLMLAPSACGKTTTPGITDFCATLAQVGTQLTPAMPVTGLYFLPDR